ncbi:MAG: acetylxylan esterase [Actinobacteria bacterium]|nr:acetylxylan esterase [Actinomycetota bacterium]
MPSIDWTLDRLRAYRPPSTRPPDFDAFWAATLAAHQHPFDATRAPVDYPVPGLTVERVTFAGYGQGRVAGWLLSPPGSGRSPGLVVFHGYTGNRGAIFDVAAWALQGFVTLAIDVRGQTGESTDPDAAPDGHAAGWMTQGIGSPATYYYRAVYVDCVRAVRWLQSLPHVRADRVGCTGISQGGGLTLATAALEPTVAMAMAEVPYLCDFPRAVAISQGAGRITYTEIAWYCRAFPERTDQAFRTLSYFDGVNLAGRIRCPTLVSVGLWDDICPPSTIFAAYHNLACEPRKLDVYPYLDHATTSTHRDEKVRWAWRHLQA